MRRCGLCGSMLKDQCVCGEGGYMVAYCRWKLHRFAGQQTTGCWEWCLCGGCEVTCCEVRVAEVGAWWLASQQFKGVQGTTKVNMVRLRLVW